MTMTRSQLFEQKQTQSNDSLHLVGKLLLTTTVTSTTPINPLSLNPFNLGSRATALANVFSRFRFKYVNFKFTSQSGSNNSSATSCLGVSDDSTENIVVPQNTSDVLELRSSASYLQNQTIPSEFVWMPVDRTKWYYTQPGSTGSDSRLSQNAELYVGAFGSATTGVNISIEIDFSVVFCGAVDNGSA